VTIPRPHWSLPEEYSDEEEEDGDDEDESHDNSRNAESIEAKKADAAAKEAEALKYDHKPAAEFPESPFIISKQAEEAYVGHHIAALKRDQDLFGMHIYNDWTGYGMQEVIENQLSAFNNTMNVNKGQEPDAVDLWIKLSVFAHWANGRELQPWMMMDDATKWRETGAMVGLMTLATLNALHRSGLLTKDSPIKDLGLIIALMGNFFADCASLTGEVPILEGCDEMETWQYEVVHYAKTAGVEIKGVHDIEKKFVEEHSSEEEVGAWKTREGVDRWGWKAKVSSYFLFPGCHAFADDAPHSGNNLLSAMASRVKSAVITTTLPR
jgi:hypothetical protein